MTVVDPAVATTSKARPDLRGFWRRFGAIVTPLPVFALIAALLCSPSVLDSSFAQSIADRTAHPGAAGAGLWFGLAFSLLMVPAVMAVAWVSRRGAPRLTLAGGAISLAAFAAGTTLPDADLAAYVAGRRHLDPAAASALNDAVLNHPTVSIRLVFFLATQAIGLVLLGLALWRSRALPGWVAACLGSSGPAHILGVAGDNIGVAAAWALTAVGFVGASVVLLRQTNDEFDLPPAGAASATTSPTGETTAGWDARTGWRTLLAVTAPWAALIIMVGRYLLPYETTDPPEVIFDKLVAATTFVTAQVWIDGAVALLGFVGVVAVAWVARRRAPVATTIGVLLALPGYLALNAGGPYGDLLAQAVGHDRGLDHATALQLGTGLEDAVWKQALGGIFVFGHLFGTIVLGIAVWRARVFPVWLAAVLTVSQPIHLTSVLTEIRWLELVGWGLTAVGFAYAGWLLLRMSNDEFDLPPVPPT